MEIDEINLLDYVEVIVKRRRMILRNAFAAAALMAVISLVLPRTYTATTTLLPPEEGNQEGLRGLLANSPLSFLDFPGVATRSSEMFVEILKSRTVAEGVLQTKYDYDDKRQNLYEVWDLDTRTEALKRLRKKSTISSNEQGVIEVSVELRDPNLAAQVARAYVAELDSVNQEKSFSKAKNSRIYIEEQLEITENNLKKASRELADFQATFKAVNLEEQTKVAIEKAGEIKGTIMAKEVALEVARETMKADNPVILRLQKELQELRKQFEHLQFGNSVPFEEQKDYFIPFADVPEVGLRFAELIREVKVQETVWQLLNQQYYSAKIQEARDTPTVQVLDEAVPPEKRTKPHRTLLVLVASFLAFMFSIFGAFVMAYGEKLKEREADYQKVRHFAQALREDYGLAKATVARVFQRKKEKQENKTPKAHQEGTE
ncbi:MAG: GumC family protein [bacterium]